MTTNGIELTRSVNLLSLLPIFPITALLIIKFKFKVLDKKEAEKGTKPIPIPCIHTLPPHPSTILCFHLSP